MDKPYDLHGRIALVSGASSGLGRHFALTLARAGARVVLAARRTQKLEELAGEIESEGGKAAAVTMDVTEAASIKAGFDDAQTAFGVPGIIVNNSGVAATTAALEISQDEWDKVLDTNLRGAWLLAQEASRRMVDAQVGGSIINIASILGFRVANGLAAYAASKAALVQVTRTLALELARHGIRVNAIAPGYILTDMNREFLTSEAAAPVIKRIPQRRVGAPEDLDGALLLLASDASGYMTGSTIVVDGGHLQSSL
ncbi:MAG: SDR family NAD(P)-dependent oxidoreductase [Gammaproteobacteria bacterium]